MLFSKKNALRVAYRLTHKSLEPKLDWIKKQINIDLVPISDAQPDLPVLRITKNNLILEYGGQALFFHPSMAILRMINLKRGIPDRFLNAVNLTEGDTILDATMGLASDALIAAWAVGTDGQVLAVEYSPLIYLLVKDGLIRLQNESLPRINNQEKKSAWQELIHAAHRIKLFCANHDQILKNLPDNSVDVVYFDPMFRKTVEQSSSIKPLKIFSYPEQLKRETINQACRVARKRVVLKERKEGGEFERLGFKSLEGGLYSPVKYGAILLDKSRGNGDCSPL